MLTIGAACGRADQPSQVTDPTTLIVGFPESNIAGADLGPSQFTSMLSQEGLMSGTSADGRPLPRLVESYQWTGDGRQLKLTLREGVFFHDGTPMTAAVVADILRGVIARPNSQASYSSLADVSAVVAAGDRQLVLQLSQPSAFLLEDLIMPLSLRRNVGTGPFRVVRQDQSEILLEAFDRYHQGRPSIHRVQVRNFDTLRTAWSSLLRQDVDMVTDVPAEAVEFIQSEDVGVIRYKRWYQYMVAFNSRKAPFESAAVRQALNVAVNRPHLIRRALRGYGSPSTGPLWPKHWAYDASVNEYVFDPRLSIAQLDAAGLKAGAAGSTSDVPHARFKFTCLIPAGFNVLERLALELQKQMYDVGVDMQFEVVKLEDYNNRIRDGQFEAVLVDMISGPGFGRPFIFWRSGKDFDGLNKFGYENADVERLFALLRRSALNEAATRSATNRLQRLFLEDPPALFLAWSERARVVGPKFEPVTDPDRDPVLTLWRWTPAAARTASSR